MTFKEFSDNQKKFFAEWQNNRTKIALEVAINATSIAIDRVQEKGESSTGAIFGIYASSTQKYKNRKGRNESPFPKINYTDEAIMLKSTRSEITKVTKDSVTVTVAPKNQQRATVMGILNQKSIKNNTGKIVALNQKEINNLKEDYEDSLNDVLKSFQ